MGYVYRGPEGLLIWSAHCGPEDIQEVRGLFPWWGKVRWIGAEDLDDFAPNWHPRPVPRFIFKEANTGRVIGSLE